MAFPPKSQRDQMMLLLSMVALALVFLYWNFVYSPKNAEVTTLEARVDTLEARNRVAKSELAKGSADKLKAEAEQFQRDLEIMRQLVPTGNEVPSLLEQVSTAARRVGLDLSNVEPQPVVEGEQFDTYRYKIALSGGYHAVAEFLTNVGSLTRIVAPVNVALTPKANSAAAAAAAQARPTAAGPAIDSKFEIQTYVAKTAPPRGGRS
jgi:type IV pilus assembly protein PilO